MSIAIPLVDLTAAVVGTSGIINFQSIGQGQGGVSASPYNLDPNNRAHLNVFNDSKCSLFIQFVTEGDSDHLTPGAWRTYALIPGEAGLTWKVESVMNVNAPIAQLACTFYFPGENVDAPGTLGNSPIGGGVLTTVAQTLSNEGNPAGTLVEDIGDTAFAQLFTLFTDGHSVWAVDQSGVKHQVLKVNLAGNPLQLGQSGDITELLGNFTVDGTSTLTGDTTESGKIIMNNPATTTNGTSGSITFYTPFWGSGLKVLVVIMAGYINNAIVSFNFPTSMARGFGMAGTLSSTAVTFSLFNSGVAQTMTIITALAATGGSDSGSTTVHGDSFFTIPTTVSQFQMGTNTVAINAAIILIGV